MLYLQVSVFLMLGMFLIIMSIRYIKARVLQNLYLELYNIDLELSKVRRKNRAYLKKYKLHNRSAIHNKQIDIYAARMSYLCRQAYIIKIKINNIEGDKIPYEV